MAKPKMSLNLDGLNHDSGMKSSVVQTIQNMEQKGKTSTTPEPRTYKRIPYKKIYSSKLNDYPIENISELEGLLLMHGLLEPFSVNYDDDIDMYELESGDRRFHALQNLFKKYENSNEDSPEMDCYMQNIHCLYIEGIYCMVEKGSRDRDFVRERIIVHNETNRPFDAMRTSSKISELAEIYTKRNQMLPPHERFNVNEKIAESLKNRYTVRQIIRYKNFDKLIDELKNVIIKYDMSVSEISTYHSLTEEEQQVLAKYIDLYHEDGKKLILPSMEEIRSSISSTVEEISFLEPDPESLIASVVDDKEPEQNTRFEIEEPDSSKIPGTQNLEDLKAMAAKRIKEEKGKKDRKISDTMSSIQKKSLQLEKALYAFIDEADENQDMDFEQLIKDLDSTIQTLNSIKSSLKQE